MLRQYDDARLRTVRGPVVHHLAQLFLLLQIQIFRLAAVLFYIVQLPSALSTRRRDEDRLPGTLADSLLAED